MLALSFAKENNMEWFGIVWEKLSVVFNLFL